MEDIFVAQLMTPDPLTVGRDTLVEDAAEVMLEEDIGSVVVVDDSDRLAGVLTRTDFVRIVAERRPKDRTAVAAYMSTDVVTTTAQTPIQEAANVMIEHGFHHLPVVDEDDGIIGIITTTDLTGYLSSVQTPTPS